MSDRAALWDTLGIDRTSDRAAIRRAYAARLKLINAEDDPEGFQRLRAAYEQALQEAALVAAAPAAAAPQAPSPSPAQPAVAPVPDGQAELRAAAVKLRELEALLKQAPVDEAAGTRAVAELLDWTARLRLLEQHQVEHALATLLLRQVPRSDFLLEQVYTRLGWQGQGLRPQEQAFALVGARVRSLAFEGELAAGQHALSPAYRALREPRRPLERRLRALLGLDQSMHRLLQLLATQERTLLPSLNAAAVAWWQSYLARPRITRTALALAALMFVVVGLGVTAAVAPLREAGRALAYGAVAGVLAAALTVAGKLFLFDWPAHLARRRWATQVPSAIQFGWYPVALVLPGFSALAPEAFTLLVLAPLGVLAVLWAAAMRRIAPQAPGTVQGAWVALGPLLLLNVPMVVWVGSLAATRGLRVCALMVALAATAESCGHWDLAQAWRLDLAPRLRRASLVTLTLAAGALLAALVLSPQLQPLWYMALTAVVLLQRPAAAWLPDGWARPRYYSVVALYFLSSPALSSLGIRSSPALAVAAWYLTGVVPSLLMCLANEWRLRRE
ncbi:MAG TPA: hypothetical protein VL994_09695 [Steroidobacteraceae bacterium]|nr:hypothetical protein [Steroidobacteraceae bacterium]